MTNAETPEGTLVGNPKQPESTDLPDSTDTVQDIDRSGAAVETTAGGLVLEITTYRFSLAASTRDEIRTWVRDTKTITPPSGWKRASVWISEWFVDLYPRERPISYLGVDAGIELVGNNVEVSGAAIVRDSNYDDPWRGYVKVKVMFIS